MAINKKENTQILVTFPKDMVKEIDNFWHSEKFMNRSEAIRTLVKKGLEEYCND